MLLQGHVGSSAYGVSLLEEESMVPELIRLAEECGVFSIRGYAPDLSRCVCVCVNACPKIKYLLVFHSVCE